jgi:hypothetical protein
MQEYTLVDALSVGYTTQMGSSARQTWTLRRRDVG